VKAILRHIAVYILSGLFLASSAGVYLTIHYCSHEDVTGIFLFRPLTEEPCEHHAPDNHGTGCCENGLSNDPVASGKCYAFEGMMAECCSNTVVFISVEDHFVKNDQHLSGISQIIFQIVFGNVIVSGSDKTDRLICHSAPESPPDLYGKELALFNRILLL
jgi:hypothetical protein